MSLDTLNTHTPPMLDQLPPDVLRHCIAPLLDNRDLRSLATTSRNLRAAMTSGATPRDHLTATTGNLGRLLQTVCWTPRVRFEHTINAPAIAPAELALLRFADEVAVHTVGDADVAALAHSRKVMITSSPDLADISGLVRVETLHIMHCPRLANQPEMPVLPKLRDYAWFGFGGGPPPKWTDLAPLAHVARVLIACHGGVTDVSPLARVPDVHLSLLTRVSDVSALRAVHTLTLAMMPYVTDVSALATVRVLTLRNLRGVREVAALAPVPVLNLVNLGGVADFGPLVEGRRALRLPPPCNDMSLC